MNINDFSIIETYTTETGESYPVYDLKQISDAEWSALVVKSAREIFRERNGREPANDLEAITYQREYLAGRGVA